MNPEDFQSLVASGRLTQAQTNKLLTLAPGAYCFHRSWGFGKVNAFDLVLGQILVDFAHKPKHAMKFDYAADSLETLGADHLLARKASDPQALKTLCRENPAEVIRCFAVSFGEKALASRLEEVLCGDIVPAADWKAWLSSAKRASRKDSLISWPTRKTDPIRLLEKKQTVADQMLEQMLKARSLPLLLDVAEEVLRKMAKSPELKSLIPEIIKALDEHIRANRERDFSVHIEAAWVREDLAKLIDDSAEGGNVAALMQEVHNLHGLVSDLSAHRQRHILPIIKKAFPDWERRIHRLLDNASANLAGEIVDFLVEEGKEPDLQEVFAASLREHRAGSELMIWLCRNRERRAYTKWLPPLINGHFLSAILHQIESAALDAGGRRKNPLAELLLSDPTLIADLVRASDAEEARDLGKAILMNPGIEELDKRSLMARLIKVSPSVQSLLVTSQSSENETLVVSWESLERRKDEYQEIINKKIPENSREIAIAREYGDLRENHEFKAAKEMQTVLMRQKADLEQMLSRARGTDFYKPNTSVVSIGTRVTVAPVDGGENQEYTILGAWDSDPERNIISYLTTVAAALLNKKTGEETMLPGEQGERRVRIVSIEAAVMDPSQSLSASSPVPEPAPQTETASVA